MNRTHLALGLTMSAALAATAVLFAAPPARSVIHTNKTKFRIPFKFNPADLQALGARQVILYTSSDQGENWQQAQAVLPSAEKFSFQAPADGEYWFVVRTLDGQNRLLPDSHVSEPELEVVVDTKQPTLKLELSQSATGRVVLRWTAEDENLDLTQLRLEYSQPGIDAWQNVSVIPKASGQTEWTVPSGGIVAVRGAISDKAKNTAQDQATLRVTASRTAVPGPDFSEPVANEELEQRAALPSPAQVAPTRFIPAVRPAQPPRGDFVSHQRPASNAEVAASVDHRLRVIASTDFNIAYKLQDVGPSGIGGVELYMTEDNGSSWAKFAEDNDTESPIAVRVPGEGMYGFAFVVRSGVGLASDPPRSGDRPEIVVAIDRTAPRVELLPLEQGRGPNLNKVLIQWTCEDENPADQAISLSYAAEPQGPWHPIVDWTENTGRYVWTLSRTTPHKFYVRAEARDAAGKRERHRNRRAGPDRPRPALRQGRQRRAGAVSDFVAVAS